MFAECSDGVVGYTFWPVLESLVVWGVDQLVESGWIGCKEAQDLFGFQ